MRLFQYTDDMALVAHLTDTQALSEYQQIVNSLIQTFAGNSLDFNISKTKELCCGDRENSLSRLFSHSEGQVVEQVQFFKYLGTEIDTCL